MPASDPENTNPHQANGGTMAAVDLGSNSFHMIVASLRDGELTVIDRLREMVRLADGLDDQRRLSREARQRAIDCLARFGQRLRELHSGNVRAVGTNTLRSAANAGDFLAEAEAALGHPIEIISGVEEARLIYLGVSHSVVGEGRRVVVDIGGGSTEVIVGEQFEPLDMESLYMGCVSMTRRFFADGQITRKRVRKALTAAQMELEPHARRLRRLGWETAIGASGTARALGRVAEAQGWSESGITFESLECLLNDLVKTGSVEKIRLAGLGPERTPVFTGGAIVMHAVFKALGITHMQVSDGALREGLLYDTLGRIRHEDVRDRTVQTLARRFDVDEAQGQRVAVTAAAALNRVADAWSLRDETSANMLTWAARLHELGLAIAHSQYHKHGAYVIGAADMPGFSRQDQAIVSALVRLHRRKYSAAVTRQLPGNWPCRVKRLSILLRIAVALHRGRSDDPLPAIEWHAGKRSLELVFPAGWLEQHPLTAADLEQEAEFLTAAKYVLTWR